MAFIQYLKFDNENLPLPTSYDLDLSDVEADSGGETEAGTTQRDVIRAGVVTISVSFSVSAIWLSKLSAYARRIKSWLVILIPKPLESVTRRCISQALSRSWRRTPPIGGFGRFLLR